MLLKEDKQKRNSNASRGYCGWYNNWYLRSMREYRVARYLTKLEGRFEHIRIGYEINYTSYNINGRSYKPDFYIFKHDKLRYIIEVKGNKTEAEKYKQMYTDYFLKFNIKYILIYKNSELMRIDKHSNITNDDIEQWKENSIYDYSGINNPRYGIIASKETKRKIGDKTLERNKDPDWKKYHSDKVKESMTDEVRKKISNSRKRYIQMKKVENELTDPIISVECKICSNLITKKKSEISSMKENLQGCSYGCTIKLRMEAGTYVSKLKGKKHDISNRLRNDIKKLNYFGEITNDIIKTAKNNGVLPKNSPLSEKSMKTYFNSNKTEDIL